MCLNSITYIVALRVIVISNRDAHFLNLQGAHHLRRDNSEALREVKSQYYKDDYDDNHINGDDYDHAQQR